MNRGPADCEQAALPSVTPIAVDPREDGEVRSASVCRTREASGSRSSGSDADLAEVFAAAHRVRTDAVDRLQYVCCRTDSAVS